MSVEDFQKNFQMMDVCHLSPQSLPGAGSVQCPWQCAMYEGRWVRGMSSGGSIEQRDLYWLNPQYALHLLEQDNDPEDPSLACSFIIALTQKHQRLRKARNMRIGLHVFLSDKKRILLSPIDLHGAAPLLSTSEYSNRQEVVIYSRLPPGYYVIIPSCQHPSNEGEFLLRIFTEKGNSARPVDKSSAYVLKHTDPSLVPISLSSLECCRTSFLRFAGADEMIDAFELHLLLKELVKELGPLLDTDGFDLESCRSLVSLMDICGFGKLGWEEFQSLWSKICSGTYVIRQPQIHVLCKENNSKPPVLWELGSCSNALIFCQFDPSRSGSIDCYQLVPALQLAGLTVDEFLVQLVGLRYCQPDRTITYSSFICCLLKLDTMTRKFQESACASSGMVTLNYQQWLRITMYN